MKLQNVLRGITYIVVLAVAVLFFVQSQKAVARLTALSNPLVEAVAPAPAPTPAPDLQAQAARHYEALQRQEAAQASAAQAARIKAALDMMAISQRAAKRAPKPVHPAYSFAASGPELMPLEGWVDQPNKDRPGRIHTNLMVRHVKPATAKEPGRAPCLKMVARPAERIQRPYGWIDVPARTIPVPCGQ